MSLICFWKEEYKLLALSCFEFFKLIGMNTTWLKEKEGIEQRKKNNTLLLFKYTFGKAAKGKNQDKGETEVIFILDCNYTRQNKAGQQHNESHRSQAKQSIQILVMRIMIIQNVVNIIFFTRLLNEVRHIPGSST